MVHVEFGVDHHTLAQTRPQARRDVHLDLQVLDIGVIEQRLTGLHRITDLDEFLDDDTVEGCDAAGIAQLGIQRLQLRPQPHEGTACLFDLGTGGVKIRGQFRAPRAFPYEILHGSGEHLVEQVGDAHTARGGAGARREDLTVVLHASVSQRGIGTLHLGQQGLAVGEQLAVVEGDEQVALFEGIALDTGKVFDPSRQLGGKGYLLVRDHRPAYRDGRCPLGLLHHELAARRHRRDGLCRQHQTCH